MTPTSFFVRISEGQDRKQMLDQLTALGTVHDDPDAVMVTLAYLKDLKAFQALTKEWEAAGRVLDIGG